MSFLQNIFGKKTKQKESATSDLPKQLESKSIQETHSIIILVLSKV
jgi:hypothetical protein